jgi:hypothetical protein
MKTAINVQDIVGLKFRHLTVVKFIRKEFSQHKDRLRARYIYECKCTCGNLVQVNRSNLLCKAKTATVSCGCVQKEKVKKGHEKQRGKSRPNLQKPNGYSILHGLYLTYKNAATKRGIVFSLSEEEFDCLTSKPCFYCGAEPIEKKKKREFVSRKMNGIDRIDNNIGYLMSNCVPCCKQCNYSKHVLTINQWFEHMQKILSYCSLFSSKDK